MTKPKAAKQLDRVRRQALDRIARIQEQIGKLDYLCSGTLVKRTKVCGKANCRCLRDPQARHGPYYEWGYMSEGKQVHRMVSSEQAALLRKALANYRTVRRLLRRWEIETVRLMDAEKSRNP
ncbi:MAG: DUF6788 family protein [Acidobacteriota bacterium]